MKSEQINLPDGNQTVIEWHGEIATADKGVILFLPALGVNVEFYRGLGQHWAERGYCVAAAEMRGMKQSSVRNVKQQNFGYKEILGTDMVQLVKAVKAQAGTRPLFLVGHSLGGQFALLYASLSKETIAGVVLLAGGSNYYASMNQWMVRRKRHVGMRFVRLVDQGLGFFPGDKLGFGGRQPKNLILDWTHEGLHGKYKLIGDNTDYNRALENIKLPVFLLSLSGDLLVPRSCADFLAKKLKNARVTQVELQAKDYGLKAFSHFSWVKKPQPVLDQFDAWQRSVTG